MRIAAVVAALMILVALPLAACQGPAEESWLGTTAGPSTTAHTPPRYGDTIGAWDVQMTVSVPVVYEYQSTTIPVGKDHEAWVVIGNIRNTGTADFVFSLTFWEGRDESNRVYRASIRFPDSDLTDGSLRPGQIVTGYLGFVLPKGSTLASVTFRPPDVGMNPEYVAWQR